MKAIAIEVIEAMTPLVFGKRPLRADSGGAGKYRGGRGQSLEEENREDAAFALFALFQCMERPAGVRNGRGFGDPLERDPAAVLKDAVNGYVPAEKARGVYRVAITPEQAIDAAATQALRRAG